jgi:hypothetical protein
MLYKGGMCIGSVVTYLMFVPKRAEGRTTRDWLSEAKSGFKLHGKIVPGGRKIPPGNSRPWLGPTCNTVDYVVDYLVQVGYRTLYTYVSR